jgi:hypothetical protein
MAKYSDIKGFTVQTVTSDPAASIAATGSFSSGGTLNTPRTELAGTVGIQTAAMATGRSGPAPATINEQYDGSSWTEVGDLNTGRGRAAGAGTSYTASIVFGGVNNPGDSTQSITESWNGSAWTEVNDLPAATSDMAGLGTQTSAFCIGGNRTAESNLVYSWNGTSWTSGTAINTARQYLAASGTTPAGLVFGGRDYPQTAIYANTESWNGSAWTEVNDLNTARFQLGGFGTSTSSLAMGGNTGPAAIAESWDGTSWTEVNDLSSANSMQSAAAGANNTVGLAVAGTVTEEWTTTPSALFQKTVEGQLYFNSTTNTFKETVKDPTAGTWASSGGLNENRALSGGSGVQTAAIYFGGPEPSYGGKTETYNGSSFTEVADLNTGRVYGMPSGHGTTTATICFGGEHPIRALTESWDGSSWTEVGDLNLARYGGLGAGTATAAIAATGYATGQSPVYRTECELYDGSSWTEVNNNNTARYVGCGFGLQTTAVYAGGNVPPNNTSPAVESWDGTSWTEIAELNTARQQAGSAGATGTDGLVYGGRSGPSGPDLASTEYWNGSSWTETNDMATARGLNAQQQGMSPLASLAVNATPPSPASEEFTSAGLSNKTITAS